MLPTFLENLVGLVKGMGTHAQYQRCSVAFDDKDVHLPLCVGPSTQSSVGKGKGTYTGRILALTLSAFALLSLARLSGGRCLQTLEVSHSHANSGRRTLLDEKGIMELWRAMGDEVGWDAEKVLPYLLSEIRIAPRAPNTETLFDLVKFYDTVMVEYGASKWNFPETYAAILRGMEIFRLYVVIHCCLADFPKAYLEPAWDAAERLVAQDEREWDSSTCEKNDEFFNLREEERDLEKEAFLLSEDLKRHLEVDNLPALFGALALRSRQLLHKMHGELEKKLKKLEEN